MCFVMCVPTSVSEQPGEVWGQQASHRLLQLQRLGPRGLAEVCDASSCGEEIWGGSGEFCCGNGLKQRGEQASKMNKHWGGCWQRASLLRGGRRSRQRMENLPARAQALPEVGLKQPWHLAIKHDSIPFL